MKRRISFLLALLTLLSCVFVPVSVSAKKDTPEQIEDLYVFVPDNQAKTLRLTWYEGERKPGGYQIYRSDSGKKGTYQKIATITEPVYTDSNLKQHTVYYYKVRAFETKGGKTVYGPFAKRDCFTKMTKAYVSKLLKNGYEIYRKWITRDALDLDYLNGVSYTETVMDNNGKKFDKETLYYPVKDRTFKTKKEIKKYLKKYFADWCIGSFVDDFYVELNGRLYAREPVFIEGIGQDYEHFTVRDIAQKDDYASFSVLETWADYYGHFPVMAAYALYRYKNRWVFSDYTWFPTKDWTERKLAS